MARNRYHDSKSVIYFKNNCQIWNTMVNEKEIEKFRLYVNPMKMFGVMYFVFL